MSDRSEIREDAEQAIAGWRRIDCAPRDGTVIELTWMENGKPQEVWPMQWGHIQRNGLFPSVTGMWVAPDGSVTWNEDDPAGAPTHWRPATASHSPRPSASEQQ